MNPLTKKILEVCGITIALLTAIILINTVIPRNLDSNCLLEKNNPLEMMTGKQDASDNNKRDVVDDVIRKQEIVKVKYRSKHVTIRETRVNDDEMMSTKNLASTTQANDTDSEDYQSSVIFEDGRVLDCSSFKGINKTEMFGKGEAFPHFVKDKIKNRTLFTCNNCSRYEGQLLSIVNLSGTISALTM